MCGEDKASNSVQACSDLAHVVFVLVSVRRVILVHIGHEGVLVVMHFCVVILVVLLCISDFPCQEMFFLQEGQDWFDQN